MLTPICECGEFGEEWHKAGQSHKKQNVFDAFYGLCRVFDSSTNILPNRDLECMEAVTGTPHGCDDHQHPALMKAVVSRVGIYDSLRSELEPNGLF